MFKKPGLLVFVLIILQVSARYERVEPDSLDNVINSESVESRIVSGWEAKPGQHPHHAAVHFMNTNSGLSRLCGGSIISKEWIVSIARCIFSCNLAIVRVGVVSINDNNPDKIFLSTDLKIHPEWDPFSTATFQPHDVGLIKLQRPLVYTSLIKPIRVQSSADVDRNYAGEQVYASGHGRTSSSGSTITVLRWVYLRAISNTECQNSTTIAVFNTTICARYFNVTSQSICNNDHGGPLVHVESDGVPTLIGISYFFPEGSCESGRPSGFLRPGAFLPWFKEVTGINFENLQEDENDTTVTDTTVANTTTVTVPTNITTSTTTTTPTTTTIVSTSTGSEDQDLEEFTPEDDTTLPPKDTEESEEEENPESPQNSKHRTVNVNVKVLTNIKQK